jgi:hypothetical protein
MYILYSKIEFALFFLEDQDKIENDCDIMTKFEEIAEQNGFNLCELVQNANEILQMETRQNKILLGYSSHVTKKIKIKHIVKAFTNMYPDKLHLLDIWNNNPHLHNVSVSESVNKTMYNIDDIQQYVRHLQHDSNGCEIMACIFLHTIIHQSFPAILANPIPMTLTQKKQKNELAKLI